MNKSNNQRYSIPKAARGIAYGDVSNFSVRNILTEISVKLFGRYTEQEFIDTLEYFDWKCPYTGRDLRQSIDSKDGTYQMDHIYSQNKECCGLNVKGNLVMVDKIANAKKGDKDIKTFLLDDKEVLGDLDIETRRARLEKIRQFQKDCGYDPEMIRDKVSPILKARYNEVRAEQEKNISDILNALKTMNLGSDYNNDISVETSLTNSSKFVPEIIFHPGDENEFKNELLKTKKAHFVLTYEIGAPKVTTWKAESFDVNSNLKANIQSRPFWRNKKTEGLLKVEVYIDYE